jgi:hypothetical protein
MRAAMLPQAGGKNVEADDQINGGLSRSAKGPSGGSSPSETILIVEIRNPSREGGAGGSVINGIAWKQPS